MNTAPAPVPVPVPNDFTPEQLMMLQKSQPFEKSIEHDIAPLLLLAKYWVDSYNRQQTDDLYCTFDDAAAAVLSIVASGDESYDSIDDNKDAVFMKIREHVQRAKERNPERLVDELTDECITEWEELDLELRETIVNKILQMITDIVKLTKGGITYTNCILHRDTIWELAEQRFLTGPAL